MERREAQPSDVRHSANESAAMPGVSCLLRVVAVLYCYTVLLCYLCCSTATLRSYAAMHATIAPIVSTSGYT